MLWTREKAVRHNSRQCAKAVMRVTWYKCEIAIIMKRALACLTDFMQASSAGEKAERLLASKKKPSLP